MLRQIPETSIGTSIVKKRHQRYSTPEKEEWKGCCSVRPRKAEEFNGQFTDVFNKNEHTQVLLLDRSVSFMDTVVSKDGVTKLLKGLNPSKALGPDELHPKLWSTYF